MREFLKGLELDKEVMEKIMVEHGKAVTADKTKITNLESKLGDANGKVTTYETKVTELESIIADSTDEATKTVKVQEELDTLKQSIKDDAEKKTADEKSKELLGKVEGLFEGKEFINDFTKSAIIKQVKDEVSKTENEGKSYQEIADSYTKDKDGVFKPENTVVEIPGMGGASKSTTKEAQARDLIGLSNEAPATPETK